MRNHHYDIILAGGGVAGLSLAYHLIHSPLRDRSILIVDEEVKSRNDVTLSYWTTGPYLFDEIVHRAWRKLQVLSDDGYERTYTLQDHIYKTIRGIDFYRFIEDQLDDRPNVDRLLGEVEVVEDGEDRARIVLEDGQMFTGDWIFDSLFDIVKFKPNPQYRNLQQHFKGLEIETPEARFDPEAITFFDFRTPQENELRFIYTLPYTERYALVEYVVLSRTKYERDLREHIDIVMDIDEFVTHNEEGGISPLTDYPFPRKVGRRIMTLGIRGGMIQPSSGYAFTRIQDDSVAVIRSMLRRGHPFDVPRDPFFYRMCDSGMLRVMERYGAWMKPLFLAMFEGIPMDRVLRFLDHRTSIWENMVIGASLVPPLLTQAALQMRGVYRMETALGES